jgi:hypothetical protein
MFPCRVSSDCAVNIQLVLSVFLLSSTIGTTAQSQYPALTNIDSAEVWFDQITYPENAAIVNGPAYHVPFRGLKTHPFYKSAESDRSFIWYDKDLYQHVELLYDSYGDILVLKSVTANGALFITLDEKFVLRFDLHGHHFKKFDEGIQAGIGKYFDVLFEADMFAVVVQRRKLERLNGSTRDYLEDDVYYILDNGKWIRVSGSGSFSKTVNKDQRKELSAFIKSNHLHVKKRKDDDMRKLGAFCYSLKVRK